MNQQNRLWKFNNTKKESTTNTSSVVISKNKKNLKINKAYYPTARLEHLNDSRFFSELVDIFYELVLTIL